MTYHLKLFYEFVVGNHPILIEPNLRKISREFNVVDFVMFLYNYVVENRPTITATNPTKPPPNLNIIIDKLSKNSDWIVLPKSSLIRQ